MGETESEEVESERVEVPERYNVVVRLAEKGGVAKMSPMRLTRMLKEEVGVIKLARVLSDINLLIG